MAGSMEDARSEVFLECGCGGDSNPEIDSVLRKEILEELFSENEKTPINAQEEYVGSGPAEDVESTSSVASEDGESCCYTESINHGVSSTGGGRSSVKKQHGFDGATNLQRRRDQILQLQRQRRDEVLDKIRQLEESSSNIDSETEGENEVDFMATVGKTFECQTTTLLESVSENTCVEPMDSGSTTPTMIHPPKETNRSLNKRKRHRKSPCKVMLSEWLIEKPEDFEEMWIGALCPVGKRCIVMAHRGKTKIFSRSDEYLGSYKSLLPGGSNVHRYRGFTVLDCVWSQLSQTFYVLDLICWNSHSCVNCDTDYRQFFLHSKFSENLDLLERSKLNPFPFKPLPFFSAREMPLVMASSVKLPEKVDGILLMHRETFYIPETNPLCLWILPSQVESKLEIYVSPDLLTRQGKVKNLNRPKKKL